MVRYHIILKYLFDFDNKDIHVLSLLCCRNLVRPGWTASSATWLTSFCWRTLPPSRWRWLSWSRSFQIFGEWFNKLTLSACFYCDQEASKKNTFLVLKPQWCNLGFFSLLTATHLLLFLAPSPSKKNVSMCIVDILFLFFFFCGHNGSKQGKEAWKYIYAAFAILGETETLFLEWMSLRVLRGKTSSR